MIGAAAWVAGWAHAQPVLPAVMAARGEIVVGVKTDFAPFGMLDADAQPVGLEVDLAHRLAGSLGLRARLVAVSTENRFQRLEQSAVDVLIATAGDTRERRTLATAVEPHYHAAGVTVMLPPAARATDWTALRGQTLCAVQGAYFNRSITQRHILTLQTYRSVRDALLALESSRCAGLLYTDVAVGHWLKQPKWGGYRSLTPSTLVIPWAIYLPRSAKGTALEAHIGNLVAQWHRDGTLIELEKTWGLPPVPFCATPGPCGCAPTQAARLSAGAMTKVNGRWPADTWHSSPRPKCRAFGVSVFGCGTPWTWTSPSCTTPSMRNDTPTVSC